MLLNEHLFGGVEVSLFSFLLPDTPSVQYVTQ